jgi:hypothetical protein
MTNYEKLSDGVIYVATGAAYREMACQSVRTLKAQNPGLAADLFSDTLAFDGADLFDRVHMVPRNHPRVKIECMPLSRFARTLYLDCDTLVVAPFGDLFDLLERFDIAMAHDVRRCSELIQQGAEERTPYAFPQLNSGVVLYRRSLATAAFFTEWIDRYRRVDVTRDQISLKDLLWASDIRFYVLPPEFNLRRVTVFDAWEPMDARPTIIHSHRLIDHLGPQHGSRIRDLETIVAVERIALDKEWKAIGVAGAARKDVRVLLSGLSGASLRDAKAALDSVPS